MNDFMPGSRILARLEQFPQINSSCRDFALKWFDAHRSQNAITAWETCPQGDALGWVVDCLCDPLVAQNAASSCAKHVLWLTPANEPRPRVCLELVAAWSRGLATIEQVNVAREAVRRYSDELTERWKGNAPAGTWNWKTYPHSERCALSAIESDRASGAALMTAIAYANHGTGQNVGDYVAKEREMSLRCADTIRAIVPFSLIQCAVRKLEG